MNAALLILLAVIRPGHGLSLNPNAACSGAKDAAYCSEVLPMIDSVDARASLQRLHELIAAKGWPTPDRVGKRASEVAATILDRAASPRQQAPASVARVWRGRVKTSRADEYERYLEAEGLQKMRKIAGNLGVEMFRHADARGTTEFVVVSYWPGLDAIRAFAGDDIDKVRDLPRDHEFLIEPPSVVNYTVAR